MKDDKTNNCIIIFATFVSSSTARTLQSSTQRTIFKFDRRKFRSRLLKQISIVLFVNCFNEKLCHIKSLPLNTSLSTCGEEYNSSLQKIAFYR